VIANATIVRVRRSPGGRDKYGDPIAGTETRTTMDDWAVAPRQSSDIEGRGRQGVIVGLTLYAPFDADLLRSDLIEVNGDLFEIDGETGPWKSPLTEWEAGMEAALTRAAG
jgi:hypothetical protein